MTQFRDETPKSFFEDFDYLAAPVTMTFNGDQAHPTKIGGFLSIIFGILLFVSISMRAEMFWYQTGDEYSSYKVTY